MAASAVEFTKMHGCGNDYIYVNAMRYPLKSPSELSVLWSAPHTGIGADGLVLIGMASEEADFSMRIFNADGTEAMMCGNACRCVGKYVYERALTTKTTLQLHTLSGVRELRLHVNENNSVDSVAVDMGRPAVGRVGMPLVTTLGSGATFTGTEVSMGNPHLVVFVADAAAIPLHVLGPALEYYPSLTYGRSNVEFVQVLDRGHVRIRVWERGSGITQACGTGASACVVAAVLQNMTDRHVHVTMDGGALVIDWDEESDIVFMTGTAVSVFDGTIRLPSP